MLLLLAVGSGNIASAKDKHYTGHEEENTEALQDGSGIENAGSESITDNENELTAGFRKGKALKKGDCIAVTAPACFIDENDFNQTLMLLRTLGYKVKVAKSCTSADRYFAGSDKQRAEDLNDLFRDDTVDAILCLRGGYGCARILDYLDYEMIAEHPKPLIGYSDVTALHIALMQKSNLATVHGPMASSFNDVYSNYVQYLFQKEIDREELTDRKELPLNGVIDLKKASFEDMQAGYTLSQFQNGISSSEIIGEIELPGKEKLKTLIPGTAEGPVIGGNLTVIASLIGTEYELQADNAILFFEEVGEDAYRIDRMLQQLYQNGLFDRVCGILIGEMTNNTDDEYGTVSEVLEEYAKLAGKPCISGVPAGHGENNMFLPLGVAARMTANEDGSARLSFLEPALEP